MTSFIAGGFFIGESQYVHKESFYVLIQQNKGAKSASNLKRRAIILTYSRFFKSDDWSDALSNLWKNQATFKMLF